MASSAPSADTGRAATASASSPSATILPEAQRVSVRAQIEVPAIAALTAKPWRVSAPVSVPQQRRLAAEQMGAAGDVEEQPVRRIERHQRREAVAPVGDVLQRLAVGGFIGVVHGEFGTDGAGIGERQADGETGARPPRRGHRAAARCGPWRRRRAGSHPALRRIEFYLTRFLYATRYPLRLKTLWTAAGCGRWAGAAATG